MRKIIASWVAGIVLVQAAGAELVGHWTFDGTDDGVAMDSSPHGNHAKLVQAVRVEGRMGQGIKTSVKEGVGAVVKDSLSLNPSSAITIALWVKFDNYQRPFVYELVCKASDTGETKNTAYRFRISWGGVNLIVGDGQSADYAPISLIRGMRTSGKWESGAWVHVAAVFDGTSMRYFVDGEETDYALPKDLRTNTIESPAGIKANSGPLYLGCYTVHSAGYRFEGAIDDVRIYNHALSQKDILELAAGMIRN